MKTAIPFLAALAFAGAQSLPAIEAGELAKQLAAGAKITVIDARSSEFFLRSHIPEAINVPAALCKEKGLPPLGRVIVYDAGLGQEDAVLAAAELNRKPGITAEILAGGFAAWETLKHETTGARGVAREQLPHIDYDHLKKAAVSDVILVDLRNAKPNADASKAAIQKAPLTDLRAAFPNARVVNSPFESSRLSKAGRGSSTPPLYVLIDRGDGAAEEMARTLRANGILRFAILTGGEEMLAREGQPGMQRSGSIMNTPVPINLPATPGGN